MAMRSTTAETASSCPITRAPKNARIAPTSARSFSSRIERGSPVSWDRVASTLSPLTVRAPGRGGMIGGAFQQIDGRTGQLVGAHILLRELQSGRCRIGVDFEVRLVGERLRNLGQQCIGLVIAHRVQTMDLEQRTQRRACLEQARDAGRAGLGEEDETALGERGVELVEHARRLSLMRAAFGELQEIPDVPGDMLLRIELADDAADAAFELSEVDLTRHQVGAAGVEDRPALRGEPVAQQLQEGALSRRASRR